MDTNDQIELIRRLFAMLTSRCEDGAAIAVEGQRFNPGMTDQKSRAEKLRGFADEIATMADAIRALADVHT